MKRETGATQREATRAGTVLSFLATLTIVVAVGLFCAPQNAWAAPATVSGTCYVECLNADIDGPTGGNVFAVRFPQYGIETTGYCTSGPMYGTPMPGHYPFTGTLGSDGGYQITVTCAGANMYPNHYSSLGVQNVGSFKIYLLGTIELQKHGDDAYAASMPDATLAGATYEVLDESGNCVQTLTTNAEGRATASDLPAKTYTIRETNPSPGYALDNGPQTVTVRAGETSQVDSWENPLAGSIALVKSSSHPSISANNSCYSLSGAVYGIYRDAACTDQAQRTVTDEEGRACSEATLWPATYWVREVSPPPGFTLDDQTYSVTLSVQSCQKGIVPQVSVTDVPQLAPVDLAVTKVDSETGLPQSQGDASLKGAVFSIAHYAGSFVSAEEAEGSGLSPTFTCTVLTDEQGQAHFDATTLSNNGAGDGIALGTIIIREVQPPEGYLLSQKAVWAVPITTAGTAPLDGIYLTPVVQEQVQRGDIALIKFGEANGSNGSNASKQPLAGIAFDIVHGTSGIVAARITTDEHGWASTETLRKDSSAGALPYGTYIVHEDPATIPSGYKALPDFTVAVTKNGQVAHFLLEDATGTNLRVVKQDASTGRQIAGHTTFRILDEQGHIVSFTSTYPTLETLEEFTTDETGSCTLPEKLNGSGTYYIQEITAPYGYVLNEQPVAFTLDTDASIGVDPEHPLTVILQDSPQMGRFTFVKTDAHTGQPIAQANTTWDICAATDIVTADGTLRAHAGDVVTQAITDESGTAKTGELYLGAYTATETHAPEGYERNPEAIPLNLLAGDQQLSCIDVSLAMPNTPLVVPAAEEEPLHEKPSDSSTLAKTGSGVPSTAFLTCASCVALCVLLVLCLIRARSPEKTA